MAPDSIVQVETYTDLTKDSGITSLQAIIPEVSYEEASELGESLISFFEAFYGEGNEDDTGTSS